MTNSFRNKYFIDGSEFENSDPFLAPRDPDQFDEKAYGLPTPDERKDFIVKVVNTLEDSGGNPVSVDISLHASTNDDEDFVEQFRIVEPDNQSQPLTIPSGNELTGDEIDADNVDALTSSAPISYWNVAVNPSAQPTQGKLKIFFNSQT